MGTTAPPATEVESASASATLRQLPYPRRQVIHRRKTLKLAALQHEGLANPEAIARIATQGIDQMSGYLEVLGSDRAERVGEWVWIQAQNAWVQG